jgi:hypothetical protein
MNPILRHTLPAIAAFVALSHPACADPAPAPPDSVGSVVDGNLEQSHEQNSETSPTPEMQFFTPEPDRKGLNAKPESIDPSLPNILLLGDSISVAYTIPTRNGLKGKANVFRADANCGSTVFGLENLDKWLGQKKWDIIHFNWGLHDLCYRHPKSKVYGNRDKVNGKLSVPLADYEINLEQLVARLKATGATLIWASTTIVPEGEAGRFAGDEIKYNQVAAKIMARHQIPINDLHAVSKSFDGKHFIADGDVHFNSTGSAKLAQSVVTCIEGAIQTRK